VRGFLQDFKRKEAKISFALAKDMFYFSAFAKLSPRDVHSRIYDITAGPTFAFAKIVHVSGAGE
jgi:hypothetical protein